MSALSSCVAEEKPCKAPMDKASPTPPKEAQDIASIVRAVNAAARKEPS